MAPLSSINGDRRKEKRIKLCTSNMKEKNARAEKEKREPKDLVLDLNLRPIVTSTREVKGTGVGTKISPKTKESSPKKTSITSGQSENASRVEVVKVSSDKELVREIERISFNLAPDKEWSIRMAAMQRLEGIVLGGATRYKSFPALLKHLVTPFITQLLDRRSSVVKQVCHLLCLFSKETSRDFEACAELLILVLFKLVVITIQVIAESADNCIKTILCNCKVARIIPRIIDSAKNDRSAVLRARCCEYALLILESWVDSPEVQKSADLYEDLIKCCIEDATSEVRATARACYRLFSKTWPDRSLRLFESFDPARQKVINDEEGDLQKKPIPSPDKTSHVVVHNSIPCSSGYENHDILLEEGKREVIDDKDGEKSVTESHDSVGIEKCEVNYPTEDSYFSEEKLLLNETHMVDNYEQEKEEEMGEEKEDKKEDKKEEKEEKGVEVVPSEMQDLLPLFSDNPESGLDLALSYDPQTQPQADPIPSSQNSAVFDKTIIAIGQQKMTDLPVSNLAPAELKPNPKNSDETHSNYVPNFQRPLLRKQMTNWFLAKDKKENPENTPTQFKLGEMPGYADVPSSLTEALTEGLNPKSDWIMRVFVFNFLKSLLNHGPKGLQEVLQNFDKVMKLLLLHLDDAHYKVAHASLTTLEEIVPRCKKQTEHYLDRILPRVFSKYNDPKESIRKLASEILDIISENYGIDSILPGLLRCLDEQKAPRAKFAIIEYAKGNFEKCTVNTENYLNSSNSFIKLWLGKLLILFKDKNTRLKEAALVGILTIYTNFDPGSVLGFLTGLSVDEQKPLRVALKQRNPRIDADLVSFMQAKKQRPRYVPSLDRYGVIEPAFSLQPKFKFRSVDLGPKSSSSHVSERYDGIKGKFQKFASISSTMHEKSGGPMSYYQPDDETSSTQILGQVSNGTSRNSNLTKLEAMHQLVENSRQNGNSGWLKHLHQFSIALLEMMDDADPSVRELSLSLLVEMLDKQKDSMEEHLEVLIMKLLHATKDSDMKIVNQAQRCLNVVITQYEPLRCLAAIRPLLACDDEKLLIVCTNSLAKIIGQFSQEDLMAQLLSFVPSLLDLTVSRSPYVRKTVLLCLVEIYLKLGNAFLPYLDRLDAAQLQLVTTYASRCSQPELMVH